MINFNQLVIVRASMLTINPKKKESNDIAGSVDGIPKSLIMLSDNVKELIIQRLMDAAGKYSKAFELDFGLNGENGNFAFSNAYNIKELGDDDFLLKSYDIGRQLAATQTRSNIPGGYFILIQGVENQKAVYIFIKAEPHEALTVRDAQIEILKKVFLSPSQKLYKIGIYFEKGIGFVPGETPPEDPNEDFAAFLFDDQFRTSQSPAEYFYKEFLGLSVDKNAKIQTQKFYDNTLDFFQRKVDDHEKRNDLIKALKVFVLNHQGATITPHDFAQEYIPQGQLRDDYVFEVANYLPNTFQKDIELVKNVIKKRALSFPGKIKIMGPESAFNQNVKVVYKQEDFEGLDPESENYTILKIEGKPFQVDE